MTFLGILEFMLNLNLIGIPLIRNSKLMVKTGGEILKTKKLVFLLLIFVVVIAIIEIPHFVSAKKPNLSKQINTYMNAYKDSFSGTVLVVEGGKIVFEKGYGMSDYAHHIPNTLNTEFRIASITKQFTAMAILQLQEKGLLNVNDKLGKYLPQYQNWENITIKELLTHTSGIPDWTNFEDPNTPEPVQNMLSVIQNKPLEFPPGTKMDYSNSNYLILGYLVEKLSGLSYENYLKKNILSPLHMNHTGLYTEQSAKNVSVGYNLMDGAGKAQQIYTYGGDGGLYSTVHDLYKWDRALYTNKLVSAQDLKQIFTPQVYTGAVGLSYGYGWYIKGTGINEEIYHNGSLPGYLSSIARYPAKNIAIIVLTNNSSSSSPIRSVLNGLESIVNLRHKS
jgi:CubicO group peptidase (beta-lactamase class C family)